MRRIVSSALLALAAAAPAYAQDNAAAPFTGPRIEGLAGWDRVQGGGHDDGAAYGVGAGYDFQMGRAVLGVEAEAADSSVRECAGAKTPSDPRVCLKAGRDLYVGGRVGTVVGGKTLLYAKAGYTNARAKFTADDGTTATTLASSNLDGVRVGAGAEYAVGSNAYVKAEYRYSNYQDGVSRNQVVGGFGLRF